MLNMTALPTEPNKVVFGVQSPTQHTPCGSRKGTKEVDVLEKQCPLVRERCSNGITLCADSQILLSLKKEKKKISVVLLRPAHRGCHTRLSHLATSHADGTFRVRKMK